MEEDEVRWTPGSRQAHTSGPAGTGTGDPAWLSFGKANANATAEYGWTLTCAPPLEGCGEVSSGLSIFLTNIPVTLLNSGTGAVSGAYWDGTGHWSTPSGAGITGLTGDVVATGPGSVPTAIQPLIPTGATYAATGCSNTAHVGGPATTAMLAAGSFVTGTCSVVITLPTAFHFWVCQATDLTLELNFTQIARSATSCTILGVSTTSDIVTFLAIGY